MSDRLDIGVIGGGLIAQVEHIPNLMALKRQFRLKGVAEPSATVRAGLADRYGFATVPDAEGLFALGLDAVLIATPDPWHGALTRQAMEAGLHVFCEKPLCYGLDELDELATVQARTGRVLQVGTMKRFDPSYEAAQALVADKAERLRMIAVEVHDPDAWPFVAHQPVLVGADVPEVLIEATTVRRRAQVEAALGFLPAPTLFRGFTGAYCSALVHDVNAVHGLLDDLGSTPGAVLGAAIFAGGSGGHASVALDARRSIWTMTHVEVPKLAHYAERITLTFDDEIVELVFPAPYLNHHPTRLTHTCSDGQMLKVTAVRAGFDEPFVRELDWFWRTIVKGEQARNTVAEARRDQALLIAMAKRAAADDQPGS